MGVRIVTQFEMTVKDPSGGDDTWSFVVRKPPLDVVEVLDDILRERNEDRQKKAVAMFTDPDVIEACGDVDMSDRGALASNEDFREVMARKYSAEMVEYAVGDELLIADKRKTAEAIRPYCSEPADLPDEDGHVLRWDDLEKMDETYMVNVLSNAAVEAYERTKGNKGQVALKN